MDPDAFTPVPHFATQGIFKAKPSDEARMMKGMEFPSLKTMMSSSFGMNQQFLSTKTGAASMLHVKIATGSMYTVLFGLLHLPDPSGTTLSEVDVAGALPTASASSLASAPSHNEPRPPPVSASSPAHLSADVASERPYVLRRIGTKRNASVARASAVWKGPCDQAALVLARKDLVLWLDWSSRSALARGCTHIAISDLAFLRKLRWSFRVEAVIVRRVSVLQRLFLDLPAALSVVSVALSCWRSVVSQLVLPESDAKISLIVDVMLTVGIAISPCAVEGAKLAIRARHEAAVFDALVCRCLGALGHEPDKTRV